MPNGTVKFFNAAKGFGFITADEGGKDFFMPAASLTSAGLSGVKTGQRVSFEAQPDGKGPKAVNIVLLADAPPPPPRPPETRPAEKPPAPAAAKPGMTFYHDPSNAASRAALEKLCAAGHAPRVVDYLATPPAQDELKSLSLLLRSNDQSLVRKYDPLFLELCLDDRFISENEFWGAIVEHPSLINGPLAATPARANLCHSDKAVEAFLAALSEGWVAPPPPRKQLSDRILQMVTGSPPPPPPAAPDVAVDVDVAEKPVAAKTIATAPIPKKAKAALKPKAAPKPAAKTIAKTAAQPKPKAKAAAKPAPLRPVKKAVKRK